MAVMNAPSSDRMKVQLPKSPCLAHHPGDDDGDIGDGGGQERPRGRSPAPAAVITTSATASSPIPPAASCKASARQCSPAPGRPEGAARTPWPHGGPAGSGSRVSNHMPTRKAPIPKTSVAGGKGRAFAQVEERPDSPVARTQTAQRHSRPKPSAHRSRPARTAPGHEGREGQAEPAIPQRHAQRRQARKPTTTSIAHRQPGLRQHGEGEDHDARRRRPRPAPSTAGSSAASG